MGLLTTIAVLCALTANLPPPGALPAPLCRSAATGRWSDAATWEAGNLPRAGARVQVRAGHVVTFDVQTDGPIRSIHVAGTLRFDTDRDTRLDVGLIKIQSGDDASESGFDCENHGPMPDAQAVRPALEIGTPDRPIAAGHSALVRLTAVEGLDPGECPAIVCCGGRWDIHGSPISRSWVKLGTPAPKGSNRVTLAEPVRGWRVGDRVIVTATARQRVRDDIELESVRGHAQTEERTIRAITGLALDRSAPLAFSHSSVQNRRGDVANRSRHVISAAADPAGVRGHTMYHRHSAGSIAFAEFRHLGKRGKLGKYSLHFHRAGDTMRGSSVVGASIWDSDNRWLTIHGTNTLVVRDCVGYQSAGHGFFIEDGTEVDNILDHNLAVQAFAAKPLPDQVFRADRNDGAGFWWANSRNAFVNNVAVECDEYGFRFDAPEAPGVELVLAVRGPDGERTKVDIRTLPFLRFEGNEAHAQRRYGVNLGGKAGTSGEGGVGNVGPDARHPFLLQKLLVWDTHWALSPAGPGVLVDGLDVAECFYGLWRAHYEGQAYRGLHFYRTRFATARGIGQPADERAYPAPLNPVDDRPPVTVITSIGPAAGGLISVRGVSADNGTVESVTVNGREARPSAPNFLQWEALVDRPDGPPLIMTAGARDTAGNVEKTPHRITVTLDR